MKKFLLLILVINSLVIIPKLSLAYDQNTTHPGLTEQIVEFYNLNDNVHLGSTDKELIIQGSIAEDYPSIQSLNHFFDFTRGIGINDYRTALDWATGINNGNAFTWAKNIEKYAKGDRDGALIGLGHILHLTEDMTVPDHTRNDPHIADGLQGLYTGISVYEKWAKEYKTRESLAGTAITYKSLGYKIRHDGSIEGYFNNLSAYSNNNYVSPDTIENSAYQYPFPVVVEQVEDYVFSLDSYFYDKHKVYVEYKNRNGEYFRGLINENQNDYSVLEEYFSRLAKISILSGAGIMELFFGEAENARTEYLLAEKIAQEKIAKQEIEKYQKITTGSFFSKIWYRFGYGLADISTAITDSVSKTKDFFVSIFYNGGSLALNVTRTTTSFLNFTTTEIATVGSQKMEQGIQKAKKAIISTGQKVILYVKENSSSYANLMSPAIAYNPAVDVFNTTILTPAVISEVLAILNPSSKLAESTTAENLRPFHRGGGHHEPIPETVTTETPADPTSIITDPIEEIATTTATSTATTTDSTATTTDPIATTTPPSEATTTIPVVEDIITISVPEPEQCQGSLSEEACLITSTELAMSWSSDSEDLDHFTIIINGESVDTVATSSLLNLVDGGENMIEIFAVTNTGIESDHIIYEVVVYSEPISINEVFFDEATDNEGQKIVLSNITPYDLDLTNWSLMTEDNLFNFNLTGMISGGGEFVLVKDPGNFSAEESNQKFTDIFTRDSRFLYLRYLENEIAQHFLGVIAAW